MDQGEEQGKWARPPKVPERSATRPTSTNVLRATQVDSAAATAPSYVYAIGRMEPRFPSLAVEKEFAQVMGREGDTAGLTDREALQSALSERSNRYLARQLCFVFTIEGLETYILVPRDPADLELLVEAVRPSPRSTDVDVVIGVRGSIAPPEACNGLLVPVVAFDQIYSFDVDSLVEGIPRPDSIPEEREDSFRSAAEELFNRVIQIADNAGATDEHRALNYLAVRYDSIYALTANAFASDQSLSNVEVRNSRLSETRRVVDVIFSYTDRTRT